MSSYTGLYVQRLSNGEIHSVQVTDSFDNLLTLEPAVYIQRQINPPIAQLPDVNDFNPTASAQVVSPVVLALAKWVNGEMVSDEALDLMQQFGFIYPGSVGHFQITPGGQEALSENDLV